MIYLAHETNPNNPGDTSCCPINYFNLENLSKVFKITELKNINFEAKDIIIIGGGGILNDMYIPILNKISLTANNLVFWGIGTNRHFWPGRINSPMKENFCRSKFYLKEKIRSFIDSNIYTNIEKSILDRARLVGMRDNQENYPCVPCPTCMHPIFDELKVIDNHRIRTGIIGHDDFLSISSNKKNVKVLPYLGQDMISVVKNISMCSKIITSSYHCAYWAMLLGKSVTIRSFSSKHMYLRPILREAKREKMKFLDWCRKKNTEFKIKVDELLKTNQKFAL